MTYILTHQGWVFVLLLYRTMSFLMINDVFRNFWLVYWWLHWGFRSVLWNRDQHPSQHPKAAPLPISKLTKSAPCFLKKKLLLIDMTHTARISQYPAECKITDFPKLTRTKWKINNLLEGWPEVVKRVTGRDDFNHLVTRCDIIQGD